MEHSDASASQLVMRAARLLRAQHAESLEPHGISPHQSRALMTIARHSKQGAFRLSDLAAQLGIAARSVTEVVDGLEGAGLVRRTPSPTDRRATCVSLTGAGHQLCDELRAARTERGDALFAKLTAGERADLTRLLRKALKD